MASPATRMPPSIPKPPRKPLQLKNFPVNLSATAVNPKNPNLTIEERFGKENLDISDCSEEMKLFQEDSSPGVQHEAARLRNERLLMERERGEVKMREMDAAFERWMRVAEKRLIELLVVEKDIRRLVRAKECRAAYLKSPALMSLRVREQHKRWQPAHLKEIGNAAEKRKSESSGKKKRNK